MQGRSSLEEEMASLLDTHGLRYEEQVRDLPGRPDFVIGPDIVLFTDGTYWHDKPEQKRRDTRVARELRSMGYAVIRVRGHGRTFHQSAQAIISRIYKALGR
jgi:G:T-mismatch repair DNA endonuclease (very short patch repair protein)